MTKKVAKKPLKVVKKPPSKRTFPAHKPKSPVRPKYTEVDFSDLALPDTPAPARQVVVLEPDPFHPQLAVTFLVAAQRMKSFADRFPHEVNPDQFCRLSLARLCVKDPDIRVFLAIDAETGDILGHALITIESAGMSKWAFAWQAEIDPNGTTTLQKIIDAGIPWAKQRGASQLMMATQLDPKFWADKYGFRMSRYVMSKDI